MASCPTGGSCSTCGGKYRLDSCIGDYYQSGNTCVYNGGSGSGGCTYNYPAICYDTAYPNCDAGDSGVPEDDGCGGVACYVCKHEDPLICNLDSAECVGTELQAHYNCASSNLSQPNVQRTTYPTEGVCNAALGSVQQTWIWSTSVNYY